MTSIVLISTNPAFAATDARRGAAPQSANRATPPAADDAEANNRKICNRPYSAAMAGRANGNPIAFQVSTIAATNSSMSLSSWYGVGVIRKRSVPRATVG